jgi:hypothetical protein
MANAPTEQLREQMEKGYPEQYKKLEESGYTIKDLQNFYFYFLGGGGLLAIVLALLIILGGILMCVRRGYALAVFSAVLAALPCLSPSACCIFGIVIGIWALVVLFNPAVKAAFR